MSSHSNRRPDRQLMVQGRLLSGNEEIEQFCRQRGLCIICGEVQTHQKVGPIYHRSWEPLTVTDSQGKITVYKGYCIQAMCYSSVEQVKEILGEIPKKKRRGSTPPVSPHSVTCGKTRAFSISTATGSKESSTVTSCANRKSFQPHGVYKPPVAPAAPDLLSSSNHTIANGCLPEDHNWSPGCLDRSTTLTGFPTELDVHNRINSGGLDSSGTSSSLSSAPGRVITRPRQRLQSSRTSRGSDSDVSAMMYEYESSFHSNRSSLESEIDFNPMLAREHSHLLLNSSNTFDDIMSVSEDLGGCSMVDELKAQIAEGDYVKFINEINRRCSVRIDEGDKIIVLEGFRLFRYHVVKEKLANPYAVIVAGEGWVKMVSQKLKDCSRDKEIVISGLLTYLTLATLPGSYKRAMLKKGGVDAVMKILDEYKGDKEVSSTICAFFVSLGLSERDGLNANFENIAAVVKRLVNLVTNGEWGRDFALRALFHFAFQRRKVQETGRSLSTDVKSHLSSTINSIRALCQMLQVDDVRESTVESAMSLLWRFSSPKDATEEEDFFPISEDVVDSILKAMDSFDSTSIREAGCGILANMSMRSSFPSEKIESAIFCIQRFLRRTKLVDEGLATCAVHSICNMLEDQSSVVIKEQVLRDIVEVVLELMLKYPKSEELIEFSCLVLAHVSHDNHSMKENIMVIGGFDPVLRTFDEFVTKKEDSPHLEIKDAVLCVLASLSGCTMGAHAVVDSELLETLSTLFAIETDRDFAIILEMIIRNTENGVTYGFDSDTRDVVRNTPQMFAEQLSKASSDSEVVALFESLIGLGEAGLQTAIGGRGEMSKVTDFLSAYRNPEAQEIGCSLLAELYFHLPYTEMTVAGPWDQSCQREVLQSTNRAMETHRENANISINGCLLILNLMTGLNEPTNDRSTAHSMTEMCLENILEALLCHKSNKKVQKYGLSALAACVAIAGENILQGWAARIVSQLYLGLPGYNNDIELQGLTLNVLMLLADLRLDHDSLESSISIRLLFDLLGHANEIAYRASVILALLAENDIMVCSRFFELKDCIESLLRCMSTNQDNVQLQICIAFVIEKLVNFADVDAMEKILQNNGVSTLCNLMSIHRTCGKLALHTCNILASIFPRIDENTIKAMSDLIKQCLVDALDRHVETADVEAAIFDALRACCQQSDYFKRLLLEESRTRMILSAMQLNLGSEMLQRSGCSLLWILSSFSDGNETIGRCGGIPTISNALLAHNNSTAVQKEALVALQTLARSSSNKQMFMNAGVINAVIYSLWTHYNDPQVVSIGLSALNNIAVDSQTKSVSTMDKQTLVFVSAVMAYYPDNPDVQSNACFYLKSCSYLHANLELMKEKESQLVPLMRSALKSFPDQCRDRAVYILSKMQS